MEDRSSLLIATGLFVIIVVALVVLGFLARQQMPVDLALVDGNAATITEVDEGQANEDEVTTDAETVTEDASTKEDSTSEGSEDGEEEPLSAESSETASDAEATDAKDTEQEEPEQEDTDEAVGDTDASDGGSTLPDTQLTKDQLTVAFATGGCSACHMIPDIAGAVGQLGPDLSAIGTTAATRVEGQSAEDYIRQSLHEPNTYIVSDCPTGPCPADLMQASYIEALHPNELDAVVGYLLTLTGDTEPPSATSEQAEETGEKAEAESEQEVASEEGVVEAETFDLDAIATIVTKGTCGGCHVIPDVAAAVGVVGPDLSTIGATASTRIEGYTAEEYLLESILEPNAFIAPECPTGDCFANIMLPNLADLLTEDEIDTIVGYLATLDGQGE